MNTTASTYHGPEVTFESVSRAAEEMRRLGPPPVPKIHLHPDDLRDLKLKAGDHVMPNLMLGGVFVVPFGGIPIVEDPDAPRLPRVRR